MGYKYETAALDRYELLKAFARKNRREMTKSERILWDALRSSLKGYRFRRQHAIVDYIADFVCLSEKLVIEVDGGYHDDLDQQHDDIIRTDYLEGKGFRVIRFKNEEVDTDVRSVILRIKEELNK
ncbi:MAG: endonuclease domain-containing protein [Prevotella sp.]|nr:endonuclease domain-containing protein [Prevotella sp.]